MVVVKIKSYRGVIVAVNFPELVLLLYLKWGDDATLESLLTRRYFKNHFGIQKNGESTSRREQAANVVTLQLQHCHRPLVSKRPTALYIYIYLCAVDEQWQSNGSLSGPGFLLNATTMTNCVGEE